MTRSPISSEKVVCRGCNTAKDIRYFSIKEEIDKKNEEGDHIPRRIALIDLLILNCEIVSFQINWMPIEIEIFHCFVFIAYWPTRRRNRDYIFSDRENSRGENRIK
jgi:hypothetical protein